MISKFHLFTLLLLFSCSDNSVVGEQYSDSATQEELDYENYIISKIAELDEVKNYKIPFSENENPVDMQFLFQLRPNKGENFYWIEVGYTENEDFQSCFNFYFYPVDSSINYFSRSTNQIISLSEWRANKNSVTPKMNQEESAHY